MTALLEPTSTPAPITPNPSDWRPHMTDELKADPVVSGWAEKASEKDIAGVVKSLAHANKRLGSAVNFPGKDAKPEDVAAFRAKVYESGAFQAPPADPKEYGLIKIENLPEGLQWSDELATKFATALHKHGVPKSALADLMPLYLEAIGGAAKTLTINKETAMAQIKSEHGEHYDARSEMLTRMMPGIFSKESLEFMEQSGLGDDPRLISALLRLAPLAMQDSSFIESLPVQGGGLTAEEARTQYADIMSNPQNPMHDGYKRRDPKVEAHINNLYRAAYGDQAGRA